MNEQTNERETSRNQTHRALGKKVQRAKIG